MGEGGFEDEGWEEGGRGPGLGENTGGGGANGGEGGR